MFWNKPGERLDAHLGGSQGFGAPFHIAYSWHELPQAGAMQVSYDTLALPTYSPLGIGVANKRQYETRNRAFIAVQGTLLTAIGAPGVITGQFQSTPLYNNDASQAMPAELASALAMIGNNQLPY